MQQLKTILSTLIPLGGEALDHFVSFYKKEEYPKKSYLFEPGQVCDNVFFINKGLVRVYIEDLDGNEHTSFFALENMFISDYSSFLLNKPGNYYLQALEETEVIVLPKSEIEPSYETSLEANMLGRKVAEQYFVIFDQRIQDMCLKTPKQRYNELTRLFPGLHQRVPQHMVASYLNISAVHLSRLRSEKYKS